MKITILAPGLPPKWIGGTEIATYNMAMSLAKRGNEVHIITGQDDELPRESVEDNINIHRIKVIRRPILLVLSFTFGTLLNIKKINPEIVHCQTLFMGLPGFLIKCILKKPYVVYGRGSDVYNDWILKAPILRLTLKYANSIIALSKDMEGEMRKISGRNIDIIPNGFNSKFDSGQYAIQARKEMRDKLAINPNKKVIIFVGRLHKIKGVDYLIKALPILKNSNLDFTLLIVGSGDEEKKLKTLTNDLGLAKDVIFAGRAPNSMIPSFLSASDIFVLPSLSEGSSVANLEAMASGLPIIATNVGGSPDLIEDGENGFLINPKDSREIAEKILLVLENTDIYSKIVKNNIEKVKKYNWDNIVIKLESIYHQSLVDQR